MGHINSMITVAGEMELEKIHVIPAFQSPFRDQTDGPSPEQRLEMVKRGLGNYSDLLVVDDREIKREGVSYTVDTIKSIADRSEGEKYSLIVGMDQFGSFDRWKDFAEILKHVNLIVTSRPGSDLPAGLSEYPPGLVELVEDHDGEQALLKNGNTINFVQLEDVEVSATEVRKLLRDKKPVTGLVPDQVKDFIREQGLYEAVSARIGAFDKFTEFCAGYLESRKSINVMAFDLSELDFPSEYTVITSGTSTKQTSAMAQALVREVKTKYGVYPQNIEGMREGRWVLLDYGATIIHLFYDYVRMEYRLEELWKDAKRMTVPQSGPSN
ncbi:MAG: nicotinate (nicotinamide) nucleotide adenylyltransferase [Bdellovibrionales bacterium]|nr:nicotinate (nicotinamide) nucleotide adenylyltransferase [Bdellovibrionales bacterium]